MSCTVCGSNTPCRCHACTTDAALPCGTTVTPGGCCQNVVQATPQPFYACAPACPEDHTKKIILQQFFGTITITDSWNIPACGQTAVLNVMGLKSINIGAYIWNTSYGYFEVTAFNSGTGQITIVNNCNDGNASPGTNVPSCTDFTITVPPCNCIDTSQVCVAIDFTAPENGDCLDITLTSVGTIQAGDIIEIGSGRYTVDHIVNSTVLNICNTGEGITPGTPVIAKNEAGDYQYCITIIDTCCSQIEANFPDGLTPCTDFENRVITHDPTGTPTVTGNIDPGDSLESNVATLSLHNTSTCRDMEVMITVVATLDISYTYVAGLILANLKLRESINGSPYGDVWTGHDGAGAQPIGEFTRTFTYCTRTTVTPGATTTIAYKMRIENASTDPGDTAHVDDLFVKAVAIGVAV